MPVSANLAEKAIAGYVGLVASFMLAEMNLRK